MNDIPEVIDVQGVKFTYDRSGKVKNIYTSPENYNFLLFDFTDQISVFDKVIPSLIPRKGEALCRGTANWFDLVKKNNICDTHYALLNSPSQMLVKRMPIVQKPTTQTDTCYIPLEVISRYYLTGSLWRSVRDGKVDYKTLGYKSKPKQGDALPEPMIEFETKFEPVDRKIPRQEAMEIAGLAMGEVEEIIDTVYAIDNLMEKEVTPRGLIHVDGKKEFAFVEGRELILVDTFGTGDEDRFWDKAKHEQGELLELSKEYVRQIYIKSGYYDELMKAREADEPEPPIPALTDEQVIETSGLYQTLHEMLTGEAL